ncbi:MAG: TIGR03960 family B12-binding radical SAM protein [Candidatus Eisenbacteria bacterium]
MTTAAPSPRELSAWIDAVLPLVEKPARYLGSEIGALHLPWDKERIKWLLILPEIYEIGMSHYGLRILYELINRRDDARAERAFAPWPDMEARMRQGGIPLFSLESRRPARDFDVIGFSLQYELLATNILNLLELAGLPIRAAARGESDPLIAGGGPCSANPEPLAEFFDFFLIGDGEGAIDELTRRLAALRGRTREQRLLALTEIPGVYVPRFYEPVADRSGTVRLAARGGAPARVHRTFAARLDGSNCPRTPIIPAIEAVQDRLTLEIQRGCTQGCRFCQAGIFYRPVRERPPADLVELAVAGLEASGWDEVSLSSLSTADYSQIVPLARALGAGLKPTRAGLSLPSLRVDTFSVELADLVSRVRRSGLTFAPEAGTQRLRDVINKRVRDEDLRAAARAAYQRGWKRIKLYYMLGLPTETPADLDGIASAVAELRAIGREFGPSRGMTISLGAFVPKAHTPFQWEAFAGRQQLRERIAYLDQRISSRWTPVKAQDVDLSFVEALLARGDRGLSGVIERVRRAGGRFEGWTEHFSVARWETALAEEGIDARAFVAARDTEAPLPWDHIDLGVTREWLLRERERALAGEVTADCRGQACTGCGLPGCGPAGPEGGRLAQELSSAAWQALAEQVADRLAPFARGPAGPSQPGTPDDSGARPLPRPESAEPLRMRLGYAKLDNLRFLSHLETAKLLTRLLRMARWPLVYTQGHNPHPRIAFGPPLPVGVEGCREHIDLYLWEAPSEEGDARLRDLAPPGLLFHSLTAVVPRRESLTATAASASYQVLLAPELADRIDGEKRLESFHEAGAIPVVKTGKGRHRTIDLKRAVTRCAWMPAAPGGDGACAGALSSPAAAIPAGFARRGLAMTLRLQEPDGQVLGPFPVLAEILKLSREELARCRVKRVEIFDDAGAPLGVAGIPGRPAG